MFHVLTSTALISAFSIALPKIGSTPELIDKINGHLVAAAIQAVITAWAAVNLVYPAYSTTLHHAVIGYYVYDILYLLISPYATSKKTFIAHHIAAIFVALYAICVELSYVYLLNILYLVLESGSLILNLTNVAKILYPYTQFSRNMITLNLVCYTISRMICFPACLLHGITIINNSKEPSTEAFYMAPPAAILVILYLVSIQWFMAMVVSYTKTQSSPEQHREPVADAQSGPRIELT